MKPRMNRPSSLADHVQFVLEMNQGWFARHNFDWCRRLTGRLAGGNYFGRR